MERLTKHWGNNYVATKLDYCSLLEIPDEDFKCFEAIVKKLAEYEDLEEQGLLLKLPCKVGDTVYNHVPIRKGKDAYSETKVKSIEIREDNIYIWFKNGLGKTLSNFMRSLWLSKEEAEKALEMEK